MHRTLILSALSLFVWSAAQAKTIERIVAVVNDEIILDTEVEMATLPMLRAQPDLESAEGRKAFDGVKRKALDDLIETRLVIQQAAELKLSVTQEEVDRAIEEVKRQNNLDDATFNEALKQQGFQPETYRKNLRRQILGLKVINSAVRSRISISDEEVKAFYNQNARQLQGQSNAHLRQILIGLSADAPEAEVERRRKVAVTVVELARQGKSFVELAKAYSDDEVTKGDGGDLGWVGPGVLQEALEQEVAGMDQGDVRGPIRTARGWHIIQLVERKAADLRPLEEVKEQIRKQLYDQQVEKATKAFINELKKKAHIDIRL